TAWDLPVATSFRRQGLFPADHANYAGDLGVGAAPYLFEYASSADVVLLLGGRLSELPSQSYATLAIPMPTQKLIHVHPGIEELGRVYQPAVGINATSTYFLSSLANSGSASHFPNRSANAAALHEKYL